MKKCYYEILEVDKKATPAEIKTVPPTSPRTTGSLLSSTTPIRIPKTMLRRGSSRSTRPTMYCPTPTRGLGTITTDRKCYSTKTK